MAWQLIQLPCADAMFVGVTSSPAMRWSLIEARALKRIFSVFARRTSLRGSPPGNSSRLTPASRSGCGVAVCAATVGLASVVPLGPLDPLGAGVARELSHASAATMRIAPPTAQIAERSLDGTLEPRRTPGATAGMTAAFAVRRREAEGSVLQ